MADTTSRSGASRQPSLPSGDAERDMDDEKGGDDMGVSDRGDGGAERAEGQRLRRGGLRPFRKLKKDIVEGLRYRAEDVARGLTKNVLREARVRRERAAWCALCRSTNTDRSSPDSGNLIPNFQIVLRAGTCASSCSTRSASSRISTPTLAIVRC